MGRPDFTPVSTFSHLLDWSGFLALIKRIPADIDALAIKHHLICKDQRGRLDGHLNSPALFIWLLLLWVVGGKSFADLEAILPSASSISISGSAIHKRFLQAGDFLSALLQSLVGELRTWSDAQWAGYRIFLLDATVITRPGSKGTDARLHLLLQLPSLMPQDFILSDSKIGESFRNFVISPGALYVGDRAYSTSNSISHVVDAQADALVRYNPDTMPLHFSSQQITQPSRRKKTATAPCSKRAKPKQKPILPPHLIADPKKLVRISDLLGQLKSPGEWLERTVWLHKPNRAPIKGRLILIKLKKETVDEQLKKIKREQGKEASVRQCLYAHFIMLFTTVPSERLCKERIAELYRLRWQIELEFKREKSIQGLDRLQALKPESIRVWILTHLLAQFLLRRILADQSDSSPTPPDAPSIPKPPIELPWNTIKIAWDLLKSTLLRVRFEHVDAFMAKTGEALLRRASRRKRKRAVDTFISNLKVDILGDIL